MTRLLITLLSLIHMSSAEPAKIDGGVIVLTDDNFDEQIKKH